MRNGFVYCAKHAEEIDKRTPPGRGLSANWHRLGDDEGALDIEVESAVERLRDAACVSFGEKASDARNQLVGDPARLVEDRLAIRYRRQPPSMNTEISWIVANEGEAGRPAAVIIQRALRGLAGVDEGDEFVILGMHQAVGVPLARFVAAHTAVDALLGDDQVQALIAERGLGSADWIACRRSLERVQTQLASAIEELERTRLGHRPTNTASDAAIVLLAGCWWLAAGTWPKPSNTGKGRFYAWAEDVLRAMRSDLSTIVGGRSGMGHALTRQRDLTEQKDGVEICCGPWLAYLVNEKKGAT